MKFSCILLLVLTVSLISDVVVMQPDGADGKDTYVTTAYPDDNFGDHYDLFCGYAYTDQYWAYIQFNELDEPQYQGANVLSAYLSLYVFDRDGSGNFYIGFADDPWDEFTVTWQNRPGPAGAGFIPADYPVGYEWVNYDVTTLVQSWLDGTEPHNGFILFDEDTSTQRFFTVYSSDYPQNELSPQLILSYEPASLEASTWGLIKHTF